MIYQNSSSGIWVVVIMVAVIAILILGLLLGGTEVFSPYTTKSHVNIQGTQTLFPVEVTRDAYQPTLDKIQNKRTSEYIKVQLTSVPMQKTVMKITDDKILHDEKISEAQTAIPVEAGRTETVIAATQAEGIVEGHNRETQFVLQTNNEQRQQNAGLAQIIMIGGVPFILAGALGYYMIALGRAKEAAANAKLIAEQRRKIEVQAVIIRKLNEANPRYRISPGVDIKVTPRNENSYKK